jgi:hypothetical protein
MASFSIVWAGFVAVVVAAAVFWLFRSSGITLFSPSVQLGCLFLRDPLHPATDTLGFGLLVLLGSTLVPVVYLWIFHLIRGPSAFAGLVVGALHGLAMGAAMPVIGTITACVRAGSWPAPGPFGIRWGRFTPAALVVGHAAYGLLFGAIVANF